MGWKAVACLCGLLLTLPVLAMADSVRFDIAAQPLPAALKEFASQANMQLLYRFEVVQSANANAVIGDFDKQAALEMLLDGTGLEAIYSKENAATIRPAKSGARVTPSNTTSSAAQSATGTDGDLHLSQAEPPSPSPSLPSSQNQRVRSISDDSVDLGEVVVTGSRLRVRYGIGGGPQAVASHSREEIVRSGQTTVAGFLGTLSQVSLNAGDSRQLAFGATSVQLRGLPLGTTLILINGRRVFSTSASQAFNNFFDLNSVPLDAIERIDVLPESASAAYGSDAIGGVVNIVLREGFDGFDTQLYYGAPTQSGTDEIKASFALGQAWENGSISAIATYQTRSELDGSERDLTSSDDFTALGGVDARATHACHPGNVFALDGSLSGVGAPVAGVPGTRQQGTATQADFVPTAGILNRCSLRHYSSIIAPGDRSGLFLSGVWNAAGSVEAFAEALLSRNDQASFFSPEFLIAVVPATNPYNPFGEAVQSRSSAFLGRRSFDQRSDFGRAVLGVRGNLGDSWEWEVAGWGARQEDGVSIQNTLNVPAAIAAVNSTDPATALNLFIAGPPAAATVLDSLRRSSDRQYESRSTALSVFARGSLFDLPAGPVSAVIGAEYLRDAIEIVFLPSGPFDTDEDRTTRAAFAEARLPLLGPQSGSMLERLAISLAGRYDSYSDNFDEQFTGQAGLEWRPIEALLIRGNFAESFRAPGLFQLYSPQVGFEDAARDPRRGNEIFFPISTEGGNAALNPESGESRTLGVVYSKDLLAGLHGFRLALTRWEIELNDKIEPPSTQTVVTNESLFPGRVTRAGSCPGDPFAPVCPVTAVDITYLNLARVDVDGWDLSTTWRHETAAGIFTPTLNLTRTSHYRAQLTPGAAEGDFAGRANFFGYAPKWKGSAGLAWEQRWLSSSLTARYVDGYIDFDGVRELHEQWFVDFQVGLDVGASGERDGWFSALRLSIGAVNLLDEEPQFSNTAQGYDSFQADLLGRLVYASVDVKW